MKTTSSYATVLPSLLVLLSANGPVLPVLGWVLPVSSPIMSLPVILDSSSSTALPVSISMMPSPLPLPLPPTTTTTKKEEEIAASVSSSSSSKSPVSSSSSSSFKVFCDLDGVLVDFEHGIRQLLPKDMKVLPQLADLEKSTMWNAVQQSAEHGAAFFEHLPWTAEGRDLWKAIQPLQPDILTGVPMLHPSSRQEKFHWCLRELGNGNAGSYGSNDGNGNVGSSMQLEHVDMACPWTHGHRPLRRQTTASSTAVSSSTSTTRATTSSTSTTSSQHQQQEQQQEQGEPSYVCRVITCWSSNKHYESGPGRVLIDDREALREDWERKGGIFIHHLPGNLENTLQQLEFHGIL